MVSKKTVQKTLIPKYAIEFQRIDEMLSKVERRILLLSHEFEALEREIKTILKAKD